MKRILAILFGTLFCSNFLFSQIDHWETIIYASDEWKYRLGDSEPSAEWISPTFDDSDWEEGTGGIGYGDGDDNTTISPTISLYLRRNFSIVDLSKIELAVLHADYDDAFVAYINGVEIARSNIVGAPPQHDTEAIGLHEATMYVGGLPEEYILDKERLGEIPIGAENTLSIQIHNYDGLASSDLSSNFFLSVGINDDSYHYGNPPNWFSDPGFSSHLPILKINTYGVYIPDEPSIPGEMGIIWNHAGGLNHSLDFPNEFLGFIDIERRGQSSLWVYPKNGFAIETKDEMGEDLDVSFLNFPEEEDWILHGPYSDKTLMRNVLTMHIARSMGQYASRTRFVELDINGSYEGVYVLMERIKRDVNRVDIANLQEEDIAGDELTGGYVFKVDKGEADWYSQFDMANIPGSKLPFQYVSPRRSKIQPEQEAYIQSHVDSFERAVHSVIMTYGGKKYDEYIDLQSFADNFIINELSKNVDAFRLSTYFYKDKDSDGGKIHAGPVWDYNLSFGNADYCDGVSPIGWIRETPCGDPNPFWWDRMLLDPTFTNLIKCRWEEFRQGPLHLDSLHNFIDDQVALLGPAVDRNFERWPVLEEYVWPNAVIPGSFQGEINFMKDFIKDRLTWMDEHIYGICLPTDVSTILNEDDLEIFPNPTTGLINVILKKEINSPFEYFITNVVGEKIRIGRIDSSINRFALDVSEFSNGIYFLNINILNDLIAKKIMVLK